MVILIATHIPLLVGTIVLYRWMGENHSREKESTEMKGMGKVTNNDEDSDSDFEKRVTESSHLMQKRKGK